MGTDHTEGAPTGPTKPPSTYVAFAADQNFAGPLQATLRSLAAACALGEQCVVFVMSLGIDATAKHQIERAATDLDIRWIDVDDAWLPPDMHLGKQRWFTRAITVRLLAPRLLPAMVERIVYLDVDMLIRHSLAPLMQLDLGGRPLAAVAEGWLGWTPGRRVPLPWAELGLRHNLAYFNSGLLVMDTLQWRETRLGERALHLAAANRFDFPDQDALNLATAGEWLQLPPRWNLMPGTHDRDFLSPASMMEDPDELESAFNDPSVVHFTGPMKPWLYCRERRPYVDEWRRFAAPTPYFRRTHRQRRNRLLREVRRRGEAAIKAIVRG